MEYERAWTRSGQIQRAVRKRKKRFPEALYKATERWQLDQSSTRSQTVKISQDTKVNSQSTE